MIICSSSWQLFCYLLRRPQSSRTRHRYVDPPLYNTLDCNPGLIHWTITATTSKLDKIVIRSESELYKSKKTSTNAEPIVDDTCKVKSQPKTHMINCSTEIDPYSTARLTPRSTARLTPPLQREWPLLYSEIDPSSTILHCRDEVWHANIFLIQIFVVNYKVLVGNLWPHPALRNWFWYGCWLFQEKPYAISTFSHSRAMYQVMTHRICELMRLQVCSDSGMNAILCFYKINWK